MSNEDIQQWAAKHGDPQRAAALVRTLARRVYNARIQLPADSQALQDVELLVDKFANEGEALTPQRLRVLQKDLDLALDAGR
jgi:hypothetical protein